MMNQTDKEKQENKEIPLEERLLNLVGVYHKAFRDYEDAYAKISKQEDIKAIVNPYIKSGNFDPDNQAMKDAIKEYLLVVSQYPNEVNFFATKFLSAADTLLNVTKKELTGAMSADYIRLKKSEYKSNFSVVNGKFVRNTNAELPDIPEEEYRFLFDYISQAIKD